MKQLSFDPSLKTEKREVFVLTAASVDHGFYVVGVFYSYRVAMERVKELILNSEETVDSFSPRVISNGNYFLETNEGTHYEIASWLLE